MKLDDDLRQVFRRRAAPVDLESRVLARIQRERRESTRALPGLRGGSLKWLAAAAALSVMAAGGIKYYEHQQNVAEARRIEDEIRLAMHVTSEALATVQARLSTSTR